MRMNPGTRVTALVSVVLALTILCGIGALLTAREMQRLMDTVVLKNLPSVLAAHELETTLLQQRGLVSAYFLEKHPAWVNDLDRLKPSFTHWLAEARKTARSEEEQKILGQLDQVYQSYDAERERAISLFEAGHADEARNTLLREVSRGATQAQVLCRELVAANQRYLESALAADHRRVDDLTLLTTIGMAIALATGLTLLAFVLRDVLLPVRRLARDARVISGGSAEAPADRFPDELRELEYYSRAIMSDMDRARTSLEESQTRLVSAEQQAAVGRFAAHVAHEIRSPLTSMKMWLFQLRQLGAGHPQIEHPCRVLESEFERLEGMATDFLQFSRPAELHLAPSDISAIVKDTLELAGPRLSEKGLRAEHVNGTRLPQVMADPDQLKQVFLNLLVNAADATPSGGSIRVRETLEQCERGYPEVVVRVEDNGPGVPEALRAQVFDPFITSKQHGTGLGLSIASNIVARHGGRLVLESSTERGSTFAVHVPVHEARS